MPRVTFVIGVATGALYMKYEHDFWTVFAILFLGIILVNVVTGIDEKYRERR